jgi:hypothetical protein
LFHIGRAVAVPEWGCHVIARAIPEGGEDATGCYPLAALDPSADLAAGIERLRAMGFVSVTLTLDNVHRPPLEAFQSSFDVVRPFKTHYLHRGPLAHYQPSADHRTKIRRAQRSVETRPIRLADHLAAWSALYDGVGTRLGFSGVHAFPRPSFAMLAELPGIEAVGGFLDGELVSCCLWAVDRGHIFSHLVASDARGYEARAAYAVYDASVRHFADADAINFGGAAGAADDPEDGLTQFKRGFANERAQSYICGAVLDRAAYQRLAPRGGADTDNFFPRYRTPVAAGRTAGP